MKCFFTYAVVIAVTIILFGGTGIGNVVAEDKLSISFLGVNSKGTLLEKDSIVELYLEEKFGVDLEPWYDVDSNDQQQVNIKIASGEVPDVFRTGKNPGTFVDMGAVREVPKELIYQYMPTVIKKCEELAPDTLWDMTTIEGKNWGIPYAISIAKASPLMYIRKDWMEKVGVTKKPDTLQELEDLFLKFRNEDPNGNGEKDEYAYVGMYVNTHENLAAAEFFPNIFGTFGVNVNPGEFVVDAGTLRRDTTSKNYKEALKFLAGWYEKGIIHPEFMINTRKEVEELLANGKAGVYEDWSAWAERDGIGPFQAMQKNNPDVTLEYVISPAGPDGTRGVYQRDSAWGTVLFGAEVSDEKMIKVMQMFEVMYTDEDVYSMINLGRKGTDWDFDEKGNVMTLNNSQDPANRAKSGIVHFVYHFIYPPIDKYYVPAWRFPAHNYALQNQVQLPIAYSPPFNAEDSAVMGDIARYEAEFAYNAIAGKIDIEKEWGDYVAQWNKTGGEKLLATAQEMYTAR